MQFVDTHCHVHFADYKLDAEQVYKNALENGVKELIAVGCTIEDSKLGVAFAEAHDGVRASVGLHPHEAHHYLNDKVAIKELQMLAQHEQVVAIGECGLDYYYNHSPKNAQLAVFEQQLQIAVDTKKSVIFHVRDAFDDFLPILDNFPSVDGVVHSFTAGKKVLDKLIKRDLYVGLNGIMTFTKDQTQLEMAKAVPLENLVLETDAPFLTPEPFRGKVCEPKHVVETARFLAELRNQSLEEIATATTRNARNLFGQDL